MSDPARDSQTLFLGKECKHPACYLHDFLPFSCPACHQSYCQPHFLPSQHACTAPLPPSMVDRIAPTCPLCNEVVPTAKSGDPNEAVDRHILDGICIGLPGGEEKRKAEIKAKKERGEVCWRKGCSKKLVVQMKCESCNHSFCPPHRHTTSHNCTPNPSRTGTPQPGVNASSAGPSRAGATKSAMSRLLSSKPSSSSNPNSNPNSSSTPAPGTAPRPIAATASASAASAPAQAESRPLDARAAAAAAAMKRAGKDVKASVPFVKTKEEKRAEAEAASQMQALKARHEKGLLSKAEELKYAEMVGNKESQRRKNSSGGGGGSGGSKKDGCVVC